MAITRQALAEYRAQKGNPEAPMPVRANADVRERLFLPEGAEAVVLDTWKTPYFVVLYGDDTMLCDGQYLDFRP